MSEVVTRAYDACVIGAGPAGIAATLELAEHGLSVLLVESGCEADNDAAQRLSDAELVDPLSHSAMRHAVRRGLGGTSAIWGGRCVPLDPIDFEPRHFVSGSGWPVTAAELAAFYPRSCELLGVGDSGFHVAACSALDTQGLRLASNFEDTEEVQATHLERWSRQAQLWRSHRRKLKAHPRVALLQGRTCVGFRQAQRDGPVSAALVRPTAGENGSAQPIRARHFVVACGGVESTRLLLNAVRDAAGLKLSAAPLVGRYYMGHPSGKIADIELLGNPTETLFGFERDGDVYVRRRITFGADVLKRERLLNIAFWLDNAPLRDWRHGSGVLSAAYLALTAPVLGPLLAPTAIRERVAGNRPQHRARHLANCLRSPFRTAHHCIRFASQRYFQTPRLPGFFTYSDANRYALHYHAEQAPNWYSAITLADEADAHGMLRARIELRWSEQDVDSIIRSHETLDRHLRARGIGRLTYRYAREDLEPQVLAQAVDGFHQLGTLRMSADPSTGVTDAYGRVHGTRNLYVASSAIFPTSGQANPTLALVALAVRQARHIAATNEHPDA